MQALVAARFARLRLTSPPYGSMAAATALLLNEAVAVRHRIGLAFHLVLCFAALATLAISTTLSLQPVKPSNKVDEPGKKPSPELTSPEDALTLWQWCTITWISPVMHTAAKRQLQFSDLWLRSPYYESRNLSSQYGRVKCAHDTLGELF